jgi:CubicO group peptidase (beta-lactamase class C family)
MQEQLHVGAQLHAVLDGQVVADVAVGLARPGVPMTPETLMPWFSCTKAVTAVAVMQQWERGEIDLDDPVRSHIPAFAAGGKERVTIRHLLTHTAGLRGADGTPAEVRTMAPEEWVARTCAAPLDPDWVPGERAGYHARATFVVLGEIVRLIDGRPFDQYVREEIFEPVGMDDSWLALSPERYRAYGDRMGAMHDTSRDEPRVIRGLAGDDAYQHCVASGSGVGPASQLARFYDVLVSGGAPLLRPQTVEAMAARHRTAMVDETFGAVIDWGLGVMCNSWHYRERPAPYGYGEHASRRAFGHGGSQSSLSFADPEHRLAVALVCNGMPGEPKNHSRTQPIITALYEDLGLRKSRAAK